MPEPEESLRQYRAAARARPELRPSSRPDDTDQTTLAASATGATADQNAFPANYEVVERIAETRLSRTWKAFDVERQTHVVIKEPRERLLLDADALDRFRREVQLVSKLNHANIVPILATHMSEPPYFYTMPLIEGEHLDSFCQKRNLPPSGRLGLFLKVCRAVIHAHQHGVIHRDLKPNNVLVDESAEPQLLDFGLGRTVDNEGSSDGTRTESVMGAPGYMAPEQAAGLSGDIRTDVYSLGVVLFQMLTEQLPIEPTRDLSEMLRRIREHPPLDPIAVRPDIGADLNEIILKALAKPPADRYQSVGDLARDVENVLSHRPVSARPQAARYVACKWVRRNSWQVLAGTVITLGVIAFTAFTIKMKLNAARDVALAGETARHPMAVFKGRIRAGQGAPIEASQILWKEQLAYDDTRTRFALWEFYRHYPCLFHVRTQGRQVAVTYSPDGVWMASVASDGRLIVYQASTGQMSDVSPARHTRAASVAFGPLSESLYIGGSDGHIRRFSFSSAVGKVGDKPLLALKLSSEPITCVEFSPGGRWFAAGDRGGTVCVWDADEIDGAAPQLTWRDNGIVRDLAFSGDETRLACASYVSTAPDDHRYGSRWVRDLPSGVLIREESRSYRAVLFSNNRERVFSGAEQLAIWMPAEGHVESLETLKRWGIRSLDAPGHVARRFVAVAYGDGTIRFLDSIRQEWCRVQGFHDNHVADQIDVCFSPDGRHVASVGLDGLRVWEFLPASEIEIASQGLLDGVPDAVAMSVDASRIIAVVKGAALPASPPNGDHAVVDQVLVCARSAGSATAIHTTPGELLSRPAVTSDGHRIAFNRRVSDPPRSRLVVIDVARPDMEVAGVDVAVEPSASATCWVEAGTRLLLVGFKDGTLRGWRPESDDGNIAAPRIIHDFGHDCTHVTTTADMHWIAACSEGRDGRGGVALWRATGRDLADHTFDEAYEKTAAFFVRGNAWNVALVRDTQNRLIVATVGDLRDIYLWDAITGTQLGRLSGHRNVVEQCQALDDRLIVTASRDRTVRVWDTVAQEEICLLHESAAHTPRIAVRNGCVAIADGARLIIADTREIQRFIDGNADYERRRLAE